MKLFKFIFFILCMTSVIAQDYGSEIMKINNYVVKTYSHTKELSNSIKPYEDALGVKGLSFKQIAPDDPQTDDTQNWITLGDYNSPNFSMITVNEGEWVSGYSINDPKFHISIGDRVFKIGDSWKETFYKLNLGIKFTMPKEYIKVFYNDAILTIGFMYYEIRYFHFENTSY